MNSLRKDLLSMEWMAPGAYLNAYIQGVSAVPILSLDDERNLTEALYYQEDLDSALTMCFHPKRPLANVLNLEVG